MFPCAKKIKKKID